MAFAMVLILWDQKLGGVLEAVQPKISISSKITMNIYNMHRIRQTDPRFGTIRLKLDNGESYNVLTFFTGYGGSTSPDGFTGNYGSEFGLAERVFAWMLPMNVKVSDYEESWGKICSRLLLDEETIPEKMKIIYDLVKNSGLIEKPKEMHKFLVKYLDQKLGLSVQDIADARNYEIKTLHYIIEDKTEYIQELRINPAGQAACIDQQAIANAEAKEKEIRQLIQQVQMISTQKDMTDAITSQQQETIETLKADYVKIFGTLTEQIMLLESELGGIKESTQALVQDLNTVLAAKIKQVEELKQEIDELKAGQKEI